MSGTTAAAPVAHTRYLSSSPAATLHGKTQGFVLRLPTQNIAHATFMQPLQCDLQPQLQETHRTTPQVQPLVAKHIEGTNCVRNDRSCTRRTHEVPFIVACSHFTRKNTRFRAPASSPKHSPCNHSNAISNDSFRKCIELRTQEQALVAKHIEGTNRVRNDRSRTRRTHEVPFIVACSHFTRKNTRFRAPASLPHHFSSSPLPFITTSIPHHFPSSPLPIVTASLPRHFPSSPLPFIIISLPHHFSSSPLPFITTSIPHHFPSSPLPIVTASLPHHFPSSPLPFIITSLLHHFPSSPLPFVTTSHRHHFPSSPLPFVTTSLRHHPSLSPPFIKVNSTASYSFVMYCYVMYCYVIYHPASFQVAEFYLSVTRKYCFPTSFDDII